MLGKEEPAAVVTVGSAMYDCLGWKQLARSVCVCGVLEVRKKKIPFIPMTLTSTSPETEETSFSSCKVYVPLSGRMLGATVSSVNVGFVTKETRSSVLSCFSPKVHLATGVGYPVMGTRMVRG